MTSKMERFPPDIQITLEDFKNSGWEKAFQGDGIKKSSSISDTLAKMGQKAGEQSQTAHSKVLWLLADACSMMLSPASLNEPFKPYFRSRTGRSAIPDDFSEGDIDYFHLILPEVADPRLKARLSDLIWLRRRSLGKNLVLSAIDSYLMTPITMESFVNDGHLCWIRAIQLTRILKQDAGERMKDIKDRIIQAFRDATDKDGFFVKWLADLLRSYKLGIGHENEIAQKLVLLAGAFKLQNDFYRTREYYETSSYWFKKINNEEEAVKAIACQAEAWHTEAVLKELSGDFIGAAHGLEKAIQIYHQTPKKHRAAIGVEDKLPQLRLQLNKTGKMAADAMQFVCTPSVDITEMVNESRKLIQEKTPDEALKILANIYPGVVRTKIRSSAEQALTQFHMGSFFGLAVRTRDGRIVAKNPGIAVAEKGSDEYEAEAWKEMLKNYYLEVGLAVFGRIVPALEAMIVEHRLQEKNFIILCNQSSIVPPSRAYAFGKALFSGYDLDFDTALHKLVPQIENMVRYHLKAAGAVTTTLDIEGLETEKGLSSLLELPQALQVFGENLIFEMTALFCDSQGPNIRNNLAHGLMESKDFESAHAVYAWCFALRLVFNVFWNSQRTE
jgi:hypothetical protein